MRNFSFASLTALILVYLNIIILNEEILILICFISFNWIVFNKLSKSIFNDLKNQSIKLENTVTDSLNLLLDEILLNIKSKKYLKNLSTDFKVLENHFMKLSYAMVNELPDYSSQKLKLIYPKKLLFIQRFEEQTTKLLVLLLNKRLNKVVKTQKFCINNLKTIKFKCVNKIILREYFETI